MTASESIATRWMRRYKFFFLLGLLILTVQVFLAYKSLGITDLSTFTNTRASRADAIEEVIQQNKKVAAGVNSNHNSASDDEDSLVFAQQKQLAAAVAAPRSAEHHLNPENLGFLPECDITAKEAISALTRAKSKDCRQHIAHVACAIQAGNLYASHLPSHCPNGNHTANAPLGCYRDEKDLRLLSGYFTVFKNSNSPLYCTQICLQSGYPYAGVQYGTECFCGTERPSSAAKLADSSCNMKCSGDQKEICGGYFSMNIYETGISKFTAQIAETIPKPDTERVKIAFLLTLSGRALRQVHRLIKSLYSPNHVFYIHVDARQHYMYRRLQELEPNFTNIRLARERFSTIWGGASLLTMLLHCMEDLLASKWEWDFVINLSESDFPVKRVDKLVDFLTANKEHNFVKSHGRETQRFIQKQGLDKTFVECDTHMWRLGDRQLPTGIQMDGGSDWVALSRSFVKYIATQSGHDPLLQGLQVLFRHTLLPAESFFHTVLRNSQFCDTYIDNNLHVTNWKRKLGCKCQYKHVVDWCGCSPNDFKPEDWSRLQGSEHKMLFFARKFEPIICQAIIVQLEEWLFGPYPTDYINLHAYWQSFYDANDPPTKADDATRSIADSLMRISSRQLAVFPGAVSELTHLLHKDQYKGFLVRFHSLNPTLNRTIELELRIRPVQYTKVAKNSKFGRRLRNFEVSTDFDQKEQVSRNFAKLLGPYSELVLSFTFVGAGASAHNDASHSYNLTLLWIDPVGRLQDFNELHIEDTQTDNVNFAKALLKQPLTPGIWTAKLIGRSGIYAQSKFLITPLAYDSGEPIKPERSQILNAGASLSLPVDFALPPEWHEHLPTDEDVQILEELALANARRTGHSLLDWTDELVGKFFSIHETCVVSEDAEGYIQTASLEKLPVCSETFWSSLAADPKSDISVLLKQR